MLIAEEFLLLAFDDETGRPLISGDKLEPALAGALLIELALKERLAVAPRTAGLTKRGRVTITDLKPTDDPELDAALIAVAAREGTRIGTFISSMSGKRISKGVKIRLLTRMARTGLVSEQRSKVLGLFPTTQWPAADRTAEDGVRQRLHAALIAGTTPSERTVTLIALLAATDLLVKVVPTDDKRALRKRARELSEGDWAAAAVKAAIDEVAGAAAAAAAGAAGAGGSS